MKRIILYVLLAYVMSGVTLSSEIKNITTRVVDSCSNDGIAGCLVKAIDSKGNIVFNAVCDEDGQVSLMPVNIVNADSIRFTHFAYNPTTIAVADIKSIVSLIPMSNQLGEVSVVGEQKTVSQTIDAITYNVNLDPAVSDKSLWEAIGRTPFVTTTASGSISSIPSYNGIIYKINGLDDPLFKGGNKQSVFSAIPAKHINRIEVKEIFTAEGTKLELNIVTKGRIEGIAGSAYTSLYDNMWMNVLFALTKIRRFTMSASYLNSWLFDHTSTISSEEEREGSSLLSRYSSAERSHGYKSDNHTYELNASYDLTDRTILSVGGTLWGKTNPHTNYSGSGNACSTDGDKLMDYTYTGKRDPKTDKEYFAYIRLQHSFSSRGYIIGQYQFYGRNVKADETRKYSIDCDEELMDSYQTLFPDFSNWEDYKIQTHTVQAKLYKPLSHSDELTVEAQGRYYISNSSNEDTYFYPTESKTEYGHFRHRQLNSYLRGEYRRELGNKLNFNVAAHLYVYDNKMDKDDHGFNNTMVNLTPSVYFTFMPHKNSRLNMSYEMSKLVPSVSALDPYRDYSTPGSVSFGNPDLDPETRHLINLRFTLFLGRNMLQLTSANRVSNNLMLLTQSLDDGFINKTFANAASRVESSISVYFQRRHNNRLFFKLFSSANYVNYNTCQDIYGIGSGRNGWYWNNQFNANYDFDKGWSLSLRATAHTRYIYLQGKGNANYTYGFNFSKYLLNNRLLIMGFCDNPLPVHKTIYSETSYDGFYSRKYNRSYTASFGVMIQYRFGNLKANVKGRAGQISTSDIKKSYDE